MLSGQDGTPRLTRDVQPEAVGDSGGDSLPERKRVPTDKVGTLAVGVVEGVEEVGCGRGEEVPDVLLEDVDVLALWVLCHKAVVVDGENVFFLGHHEAKAAAGRVLEGDGPGLVSTDALNVIPVVELVAESLGDADLPCGVSILDDDQMVRLEERTPLLEEIEVADGGDHNVLR